MSAETTQRKPPVSTGGGVRRPSGAVADSRVGSNPAKAGGDLEAVSVTARERLEGSVAGLTAWLKDFLVFPRFLVDVPLGWDELTAYAHRGAWTKDGRTFLRGLGVLWLCVVGLPTVVCARFLEWLLTRPSRGLMSAVVVELVLRGTPFGHWLAAGVVRPFFHGLAMVFLP